MQFNKILTILISQQKSPHICPAVGVVCAPSKLEKQHRQHFQGRGGAPSSPGQGIHTQALDPCHSAPQMFTEFTAPCSQVAAVIAWKRGKKTQQTTTNNIIKANSGQHYKNWRQFMLSGRAVCEFMDKQASAFSPLHILGIRLRFICREFYGSKGHSLKKAKEQRKNR